MVRLITHFQGVSNGIQDADGLLKGTAFIIGIALAANGNVISLWDRYNDRLCRRQVILLVFFLEVKWHLTYSLMITKIALAGNSTRAHLFITPFPPAPG